MSSSQTDLDERYRLLDATIYFRDNGRVLSLVRGSSDLAQKGRWSVRSTAAKRCERRGIADCNPFYMATMVVPAPFSHTVPADR